MIRSLNSLMRFWGNYGNPTQMMLNRWLKSTGMIQVVDRRSQVSCHCTVGSYRMFGEVWHDHDYDIPRVSINPDDVVLDIGANQGFFSCYAAYQGAQVYAFEPSPDSFQTLLSNVKTNGFSDRVVAKPWAVGAENGTVELICSDWLGGGMNTIKPEFATNVGLNITNKVAQIPCYSLSHLIAEFNLEQIKICKLDCEGAELDILKGLKPEDRNRILAFTIEYHPEAYAVQDLTDLLLSWGSHQISFAEDKYCTRQMLRAVATDRLKAVEI
ncbi:methyltransferase FkbM family [Thalassoporum mexicanum PCC 7367]|uniref:FkbM family methyltransferase n=1 Tax=Thalassoporum mexicanum TaxID=3457544 RepID=UPI00029FDA3E|nr:FkbM family methyltransferase [Pseudanabaena sp. PCC 7367]AFY69021.1 methyltransferase FkbM family [Pseudanabaena sp. PCC 7367]